MPSVTDANWLRRLERLLATFSNEQNRGVLRDQLEERRANGVKVSTLYTEANAIRGLCEYLGTKALGDVTRQDLVRYVNEASRERVWRNSSKNGEETVTRKRVGLGPRTLSQRRELIRGFYRRLRGTEEFPPEVRGLKSGRPREDSIPTDQLLTRDETLRLLKAHPASRDKALLAVLSESGMRAGEICALNICNVEFDKHGSVLTLPRGVAGLKTGARRVRLYEATPFLQAWYETHPHKDDPKAALFYSMSRRAPMARMTPNALWQFVHRAGVTAGLKKEIHPHLFRHGAATERARLGWNEASMRAMFGWSRSSDMPSRYVHLAGLDYEKMELERRGLLKDEDRARPALAPLTCRVCRATNLATSYFCNACRNPLVPEAESELVRQREAEITQLVHRAVFDVLGNMPTLVVPSQDPVAGVSGREMEEDFLRTRRARAGSAATHS